MGSITVALISGFFAVIAVAIPCIFEMRNRKAKIREERQKALLKLAMKDLEFLYSVESRLLETIKDMSGESMKIRIRQEVTVDTGLAWSGQFTPSRIHQRQRQMDNT
ncbi:hypothetical protein E4188_23905 (plasmid) [Aeromonas media]|uniref:Uncharacterized protein n=2 Tax=Aeromonas TaxID=642 RepID=A0ABX6NYS9_AERME|nr:MULTISPECIES: hypothetical protein [Aeromonas]ASI21434.1 hypothetical protein CE456_00895 [Aeromonas salmonicida]QJT41537.1 hypothetical protein E4188_23905 [Aeromonas media]QLI59062.1 hypothetical protein C0708_23225 [Aeromonas caviae]QLI60290.1 hypothetical protein C1C91_22875 [Aeromonas caviae]HDN9373741.1 hypothetical protein [Aeromonas salmonicida]